MGLKRKKIIIGGCECCQGINLGIEKNCICKYIIIIINNEKKHEAYYFILRTLYVQWRLEGNGMVTYWIWKLIKNNNI